MLGEREISATYMHCRPCPPDFSFVDLAQLRYFEIPAFVNYLAYLQYWRQPEYAK